MQRLFFRDDRSVAISKQCAIEHICVLWHTALVDWKAYFHPRFKAEFDRLPKAVQDELLASLKPLRVYGPALGRPEVDTLKGSKFANMKELRFRAD